MLVCLDFNSHLLICDHGWQDTSNILMLGVQYFMGALAIKMASDTSLESGVSCLSMTSIQKISAGLSWGWLGVLYHVL